MRCPDCKKEVVGYNKEYCPHCGGDLVNKDRKKMARVYTPVGVMNVAL
jgi:rRNA maturation endonuclease Nob1